MSDEHHDGFIHKLDLSAVFTVIGIIVLFSGAIIVTLVAPAFVDPSWTQPNSYYQVQMYEVADPHVFSARTAAGGSELEFVNHLQDGYTLLAFQENSILHFVAPKDLEKVITREDDKGLKLTSRLLLLRQPETTDAFDAVTAAAELQVALGEKWEKDHSDWKEKGLRSPELKILELYDPKKSEAFSLARSEGVQENWVDSNFTLLDPPSHPYQRDPGVVYIKNPEEYLIVEIPFGNTISRRYDPKGKPIKDLAELTSKELGFRSRAELISLGEHIFAIEGCWYCHTDQSRTLIQDCVINGSESFAAPPSSANEYIYQKITFPGTRRIGPDIARVGVKRPSRDWHKSHFWEPKSASVGTIMPAFRHFFDDDPRGGPKNPGIPNYKFEAVYQYLMTKGTRITPPSQAWWLGRDPIDTTELIQRGIEQNATR